MSKLVPEEEEVMASLGADSVDAVMIKRRYFSSFFYIPKPSYEENMKCIPVPEDLTEVTITVATIPIVTNTMKAITSLSVEDHLAILKNTGTLFDKENVRAYTL